MNIYVGRLPYQTNEAELTELFKEYGEVTSVKIIIDKYSGKSKGFGFVEMPNEAEAKKYGLSYEAALRVKLKLNNKKTKEIKTPKNKKNSCRFSQSVII